MTLKTANKLMKDIGCEELVLKILDELNGENYTYARNVLEIAAVYLKENSYIDAQQAKSQIDNPDSDLED